MDQHFSLLRSSSFMHPPNPNDSETACSQTPTSVEDSIKAKIASHPKYSALLSAFLDCHKVGAPPEVEAKISGAANELAEESHQKLAASFELHADPELDQFMEAYCGVLVKYHDELMAPIQEAMDFLTTIHLQLSSMNNGAVDCLLSNEENHADDKCEAMGSSEEDQDIVREAAEHTGIDLRDKEKELKLQLLRKYSGYLSNLRKELSKKKKNGKLPKEARQKLLRWWELHYKWPYPSETEKVALAESTGLDQKQINNWFINQRKRHWKPSQDMQFVVMDGYHPHHSSNAAAAAAAALYLDGQFMSDGAYRLGS